MSTLPKNPKVSVCVVTYNQVNYIKTCLDSLINQDVNFLYEIIIGDDASTDGTSEVVRQYAERYPNIINAVVHNKNLGPRGNYIFTHNLANGEYIAHLDGDDYALPNKLYLQAAFLDSNPDCSMVFHRCLSLHLNGDLKPALKTNESFYNCDFATFHYRYPGYSWHSAKMYRKSADSDKRYLSKNVLLDKHIHFVHGLHGLTGFINQDLGVYRSDVGISSNACATQEYAFDSYRYALDLGYDSSIVNKIISREYFEHGIRLLELNDFDGFKKNIRIGFTSGHITLNSLLAILLAESPKRYINTRNAALSVKSKLVKLINFLK